MFHLGTLLGAAFAGAGDLAGELVILQILGLLLGGPVKLQARARLDRLVMHLLQSRSGSVAAENHLVDPVTALRSPAGQLAIRIQVVQPSRVPLEGLEIVLAGEAHDVGRRRIDKIADRVVRRVEHPLNVDELEKDHEMNRQDGVVSRAHIRHIMIHLIGHQPQFLKDEGMGYLGNAFRPALGGMPGEGVQPFPRLRHE